MKLERILVAFLVISLILKFNVISFGGILLFVSLTALAFFYYYFGKAIFNGIGLKDSLKKESYKEIPNSIITISNIAGIGISLVCIGTMFKLNYWMYSAMLYMIGLGITLLMSIVTFTDLRKSKNVTYKRIFKRVVVVSVIGFVIAFTPENITAKQENNYKTEHINNSIFQYKLENKKLTGTLKISNINGNLSLFQDWKEGMLNKTFVVDEHGKTRELVFYSRQDSNSTTQYYYDINDQDYKTYPFNEDMFDFYEKHCFLSSNSIFRDSINEVNIYNYPMKHITLFVTNGNIKLGKDIFLIKTDKENGDTMKVFIQHPLNGDLKRKFDLIIK
jgi:hypothetical protein